MAFGKRGGQDGSMSRPAFAAAATAADMDKEPGLLSRLFRGRDSDDFDVDLSHMQPYAHDKSIIMLVAIWILFGTMGGHRFYLGHWMLGLAMLALGTTGVFLIMMYSNHMVEFIRSNGTADPSPTLWYILFVVGIVQTTWWLVDGIYVICRKLSAKFGG